MFVNAALGSALRASGVVGIPTMIQSATVVINAILAPVLIMGFLTGHPWVWRGPGSPALSRRCSAPAHSQ
jgi:Na+-driven multidrug efflux pump